MIRVASCCLFAVAMLSAQAAAQEPDGAEPAPAGAKGAVLTLGARDAARRAVQRGLTAAAAREQRNAAVARTREAEGLYDPIASLKLTTGAARAESGSQLGGAPVLRSDEQEISFGVSKTFVTGTNLRLDWVNRRSDSNSAFASLSPQYSSQLRLTMVQPLLRDYGLDYHTGILRTGKLRRELAGLQFRQTLSDVALGAEEAYWNLVLARSNLAVAAGARDLARDELRIVRAQRTAGRLAPVDVLQAEAGLASAEEQLIVAETAAAAAQDGLVRVVAPPADPGDWASYDVTVQALDTPDGAVRPVDPQASVRRALASRPAVLAARRAAEEARLQVRLAGRSALPRLDLTGSVSTDGLGRGAGEAGQDLGSGEFLGWSVGVQVEIPILNTLGNSRVEAARAGAREQVWRERDIQTRVVVEIRNAVRQVQAAARRIEAAATARTLSERRLSIERDRLQQGLSTAFLVSRAREDLTVARTRAVRAQVDYRIAEARLRRADGSILDGLVEQPRVK